MFLYVRDGRASFIKCLLFFFKNFSVFLKSHFKITCIFAVEN